MVRTKKAHGLI